MTAWRCPYCLVLRRTERTQRDHLGIECEQIPFEDRVAAIHKARDSYSEDDWERTIIAVFRREGWQCFHVPRMRGRDGEWFTNTTEAGLTDWILVRPPDVVFLELKKQGGKPSREQVRLVRALQQCTQVTAGFGRPADVAALAGIAKNT